MLIETTLIFLQVWSHGPNLARYLCFYRKQNCRNIVAQQAKNIVR